MAITYGLPYMGSKNSIAKNLIKQLPRRENFYDLFCGGGAMAHRAALSGKYKHIYCNDLKSTIINNYINKINEIECSYLSFKLKNHDILQLIQLIIDNYNQDLVYVLDFIKMIICNLSYGELQNTSNKIITQIIKK